jgi:hypothetical protein
LSENFGNLRADASTPGSLRYGAEEQQRSFFLLSAAPYVT